MFLLCNEKLIENISENVIECQLVGIELFSDGLKHFDCIWSNFGNELLNFR